MLGIYQPWLVVLVTLASSRRCSTVHAQSLRGGAAAAVESGETIMSAATNIESRRRLNAPAHYYSTSDVSMLGAANPDAAIGNPLKGLLTSPSWTGGNTPNDIPSSLEFYYLGMDEIMTGDNQFDWTKLDTTLSDAAKRNNHVIWRVFVDYPGQPLRLPRYLINAGVPLVPRPDGGASPQYDDPKLLRAFEQLIAAMGLRYDGHKSIAFIQLGLLGKWGEWHTYPENGLLSTETMDKVATWYKSAFVRTQMQSRSSTKVTQSLNVGVHDDSFGYSTLGTIGWFFWPQIVAAGYTNFWKTSVMGGETRPELQETIFSPSYVPGSDEYKQDFMQCVETTHATYMFHHAAFQGKFSGTTLENARRAHARLGYNFQVSNVAVATSPSAPGTVVVDVTVKQIGVAPFYYPLNLALTCGGTKKVVSGVETLIDAGQSKVFSFASIPANAACLDSVVMTLESPQAYNTGRPIKFAQGKTGAVSFRLPVPDASAASAAKPAPVVVSFPNVTPTTTAEKPLFVNAKSKSASRSAISGSTTVNSIRAVMSGAGGFKGNLFTSHRWGSGEFSYTLSGFTGNKAYTLTMGFAETFQPNCGTGKRVFNIMANGSTIIWNLDVFAKAGCKKAHTEKRTVTADANGRIALKFVGVKENPFVSFIQISP